MATSAVLLPLLDIEDMKGPKSEPSMASLSAVMDSEWLAAAAWILAKGDLSIAVAAILMIGVVRVVVMVGGWRKAVEVKQIRLKTMTVRASESARDGIIVMVVITPGITIKHHTTT